ncbi:MAG: Gfo/Idh/MocA family oxidoreductase [Caldilineaceae bacterium]|nr:Gfo/Idh/MocA family oxidoreductase [Caldilineaceae bacterium]
MRRVGIVGAGGISRTHADRWLQMPGIELAGFFDIAGEAAQRAVEVFGGRAFGTLHELFDAVDYVDVCTPGTAHAGPVIAALEAGLPTVCEKPLASSVADCERMVEAAERTGTPLFVAMVVRFFPQFAKAKEVLDSGAIGAPGVIRTVRSGSYPDAGSAWRKGLAITSYYADFAQSGGVLLDLCIHDIDYQRWCFGEIERVFARGMMFAGKEPVDHALLTLRFASGAVGHIEGSWAYPRGRFNLRIEIAGSGGIIEWDSRARAPVELALTNGDGKMTASGSSPTAPQDDPYYAELAHFVSCVEANEPFLVSPYDGLMAVKISRAAIESLETGKPVTIG